MAQGKGRTADRANIADDTDARAGPVEAAQLPEHRVGGLIVHIELDRVAIRPRGRAWLNHQVSGRRGAAVSWPASRPVRAAGLTTRTCSGSRANLAA
jgi:hypothetical protein